MYTVTGGVRINGRTAVRIGAHVMWIDQHGREVLGSVHGFTYFHEHVDKQTLFVQVRRMTVEGRVGTLTTVREPGGHVHGLTYIVAAKLTYVIKLTPHASEVPGLMTAVRVYATRAI